MSVLFDRPKSASIDRDRIPKSYRDYLDLLKGMGELIEIDDEHRQQTGIAPKICSPRRPHACFWAHIGPIAKADRRCGVRRQSINGR